MLSDALKRFLRRNFSSVEELEIVLLLFSEPQRSWSSEEISTQLRGSLTSVKKRLERLARKQLVAADGGRWRYRPGDERDARVAELESEYHIRQARVIDFLFSEPTDALRSFADAFRLKDDDS